MKPTDVAIVQRSGRPKTDEGVMRDCRRHGWSEHGLYVDNARKSPRRYRCKRCIAEAVTRRHRKLRQQLVEEAGGACAVCGYDRAILNLHFHHVDPATKSLRMTVASGKSIATYREEAKKCVLVCANCHGEIEMGLIASPKPGTRWLG